MSHVSRVFIVLGYTCKLVPDITHFLDKFAQRVNEQEPELIIFCGGYTQRKTAPGVSEAALMCIYVRERIAVVPACLIEEDSYTTRDNIEFATRILERILPRRPELIYADITIFCEATRALKVAWLARHFIGFPPMLGRNPIRIETDSWELMHPFWELVGTVKDAAALYVPGLNTLHRWWRIHRSKSR